MSHYDFIRNVLDLKDPNIFFGDIPYSETFIGNLKYKVFNATLSYKPKACQRCGTIFDKEIIKHGFKKSDIKLPYVSGHPAILRLNKQRYLCRHCNCTFILSTPIVDKNCFISRNTKLNIAIDAKKKISEKDLALHHGVSHSTVSRIIDTAYQSYKVKHNYLPKHLCFDEFKSVKEASGAMSFIFCDSDTGQIVDIVENRRLHYLKSYFMSFSRSTRHAVETIVIDIYSPYMTLIKALFPNASIIIDRFHIVQQFFRALNKTRVQLMNKYPEHYKKLKNNWRLILKAAYKLDNKKLKYNRHFKKHMLETEVLEAIISIDQELYDSYQVYQNVLTSIRLRDVNLFENSINQSPKAISEYIKTSIRTMKKYNKYVTNAIIYKYSNGVLEGLNNKIKVIKRIAFGYKSFMHFKNRILITQNLVKIKTT